MNSSRLIVSRTLKLGQSSLFGQNSRALNTTQILASVTSPTANVHPGYKRIKAIQEHFQIDDGVPVHLKGGNMDKLMYNFTIVMCVLGLGSVVKYFYEASFPKKQ